MDNRIYLDNAATSPIHPEVLDVMFTAMKEVYGNPSSAHAHGRKAKNLLEESRGTIAKLLHCQPGEIIFTSGGTEADNMILRGSVKNLGVKNIITSPIEHHAVFHTVEELAKEGVVKTHLVELDELGHIKLDHLEKLLSENPHALVSLMHGNNEIGNLLSLKKAGELAHKYGALFHSDTVQTMGQFAIDLSQGYVDFAVGAAHKFNGPKGIGFMFCSRKNRPAPLITGGAQERELRSGTENVHAAAGMAKALEISFRDMEKKREHVQNLKNHMMEILREEIPGVTFNGDAEGHSLPNVLSVSFPESETGEMLLFNLDIAGISASGGSACSAGANVGSHVIHALHPGSKRTTVRFSFGKQNTVEEIDQTVAKLKTWYPVPASV
ncbi:MAG: cysteine desulfurase [Bacteroidetes bacterium]|nr:cysteine desulfurase [Bacteroidota bacterium]